MPRVVIDIPSDKMQSFISAISPLGIGGSIRTYKYNEKRRFNPKSSLNHLKRISSSFILFDWEFFSNELEYE